MKQIRTLNAGRRIPIVGIAGPDCEYVCSLCGSCGNRSYDTYLTHDGITLCAFCRTADLETECFTRIEEVFIPERFFVYIDIKIGFYEHPKFEHPSKWVHGEKFKLTNKLNFYKIKIC